MRLLTSPSRGGRNLQREFRVGGGANASAEAGLIDAAYPLPKSKISASPQGGGGNFSHGMRNRSSKDNI